eukprot:c48616_g1_i1 orf=887-1063(+)
MNSILQGQLQFNRALRFQLLKTSNQAATAANRPSNPSLLSFYPKGYYNQSTGLRSPSM